MVSTCSTVAARMFSLTTLATISANIVFTDLKVSHAVSSSGGGRKRSIGHGGMIVCLIMSVQRSIGRLRGMFMSVGG